ncbi:fumarylacetoacetate hydrolase family protein [Roseiarcaceae bacterium H3SJ34-1]|uniref:fumarylacetoacetate hydrolase family protein n=1 Tax=Terripilifer ovatus TaxID=3032367 RepID=UPI003AB946CE|nr:fumarylacetoacetate hydrolase family protein [Roseiarcaceae bacterium H3SJ34-1]
MIWCRFQSGGAVSFGVVEDDKIKEVSGSPFGRWDYTGRTFAVGDVALDVPVIPGNFYAIGSNYASHVEERGKVRGTGAKYYDVPRVGYRANSALIPHGHSIMKPRGSGEQFQYEGELVAVIGRKARNVTPEEARACIFGWTIGNDVTERDWQKNDPTNLRGKNSDTFKPMGPWIVTGIDPKDMRTTVVLNGEKLHDFATGNMLFDAGQVISAISQTNTLHPGDVVWLGTDELPVNIKPGDTLDITITGIGTLSNSVVAE